MSTSQAKRGAAAINTNKKDQSKMPNNEFVLKEKLSRAIAAKVARQAHSYVTEEMVSQQTVVINAQARLNDLVDEATEKLLHHR